MHARNKTLIRILSQGTGDHRLLATESKDPDGRKNGNNYR
jgi:hypothetical protein